MVVYIDLVILINFIFDSSLLLSVDLSLHRSVTWKRVLIGALIGEISILTLFIDFNMFTLTVFKLIISFLMSIATFGYKDIKYTFYNVVYLYFLGIILGGFVTFLYNEFQVNREYSIKYLIILALSPLALLIYRKLTSRLRRDYNARFEVIIEYANNKFEGIGFLDSGNKLVSPISGNTVILVEKEYIAYHKLKLLPVPYNALNHHGIVYCFRPNRVLIDGIERKNLLIGLSEVPFNKDGCNVLLNSRMEDL